MAIRFVDREPEAGGKEPARRAPAAAARGADLEPEAAGGEDAGDAVEPPPGLTHAKPEPKQRGRKKPMAQASADKGEPARDGAPEPAEGILPGLQLHAKPTPKPRGRKKAFG